jgi:hypothetical protein
MAFVIGWSSVAFASAKPLHQHMMHEPVPPVQMKISDCHDAQLMQMHHEAPSPVHLPSDSDCRAVIQDQAQHVSCGDCTQLHCQSLSTWLDAQGVESFDLAELQQSQPFNSDYFAQHLTGFWQQILRPPKA